jgi:hypothetical protein
MLLSEQVRRSSMTRAFIATSAIAMICGCSAVAAPPQLHEASHEAETYSHVFRGVTIPHWQSSFTYAGQVFSYRMAGTDPTLGSATTTIPATVVPLSITFSDGTTIDGTSGAQSALASPLFVPTAFPEGTTQYGDAIQQGEFWTYAGIESYHVLVGGPTVETTQSVIVPAADGMVSIVNGKPLGIIAYTWFMDDIEQAIIAQLGLSPTGVTFFITGNIKLLEKNGECCYEGFHSTFTQTGTNGTQTFTTVWGPGGGKSVDTLSHEVAEWLNDPFNDNVVPGWVNPTSKKCGTTKLEVGDPLTNIIFAQGGYQLQDVAFYSWFSRDEPSIGIGGAYDFIGKITKPAGVCIPK